MKKLLIIATIFCSNISVVFSQSHGLEIGNIAPIINLPAPTDDSISLSKFRGQLVLVDFWASWCAPCVKEQSELSLLYKKYKHSTFANEKGFEIYGVSLDSKKASWEEFIKKMNINWIQVSDLKFWSSPAAKTYNIQALPFNVLINGNGIIIAKNLHGKKLEQAIINLLNKK